MRALTEPQSGSTYHTMLTVFAIGTLTIATALLTAPTVAA
jgi:hypothetical protein